MPVIVGAAATCSWSPGGAGTAALAVTLPDGSTLVPAPTVTGAGPRYDASVATTMPGRHLLTWSRGADRYVDVLDVWPQDPRYLVSVADVELVTGRGSGDTQLAIAAATWMIERLVGPVLPTQKTVRHHLRRGSLALPDTGISDVSVTVDGAPLVLDPADVDEEAGIVHGLPVSGRVIVAYSAGSTVVPANLRLAAVKIAAHLVMSRRVGSTPGSRDAPEEMVSTPYGFALPRAAWELCGERPGGMA